MIMPEVTVIFGEESIKLDVDMGSLLGDVIVKTGLPLEQPCAGRGTCGKCKVLIESGISTPDEVEAINLSEGEIALK